jgi:hypothetical protein
LTPLAHFTNLVFSVQLLNPLYRQELALLTTAEHVWDSEDGTDDLSSEYGLGIPTGDSTWNSPTILSDSIAIAPAIKCKLCEVPGKDVCHCNVCTIYYCDECWLKQPLHKESELDPEVVPHEKTTSKVAEKVRNALKPPVDEQVLAKMYWDDELTTWLGQSHVCTFFVRSI